MDMSKSFLYFITLLLFVLSACDNSSSEIPEPKQTGSLTFDTRSVTQEYMDNMRVYLFDGDNRNNAEGQYYMKLLNMIKLNNELKANVEVGLWDLGLISCEDNPLTELKEPVRGSAPKDVLMWRTLPVNNNLPDTPEIQTVLIKGVNIQAETTKEIGATLTRHVGMVRVVLEDGVGFRTGTEHSVYLKNVPTSLSWGGSLYPGRDNPEHSGNIPMTKGMTLTDAGSGHQKSNEVNFIVPTHKSTFDGDVTTHKMTLGVKFTTLGGTLFEKEAVISDPPQDNKILLVKVTAKGGVEVKTEIADWELEPSTSNPKLYAMVVENYNPTTQEWVFNLTMNQERNWWVKLEGANPEYFDFVDSSATSGQLGTTTIRIKRSSLHPGGTHTIKLSLSVSGYNNVVESWTIQ